MTEDTYISIIPFYADGQCRHQQQERDLDKVGRIWILQLSVLRHRKPGRKRLARTWNASSNKNAWNGCVTDRDQPYDTTNEAPSGTARYPAYQYNACPSAILGDDVSMVLTTLRR